MKKKYIFRESKKEEIAIIFSMIIQRMKWMDDKGIHQWNTTKYDEVYPITYYEMERQKGELFVLVDMDTNEIISAAVLKKKDERWQDTLPALYLHNFVGSINHKNAGEIFLRFAEQYALDNGKKYFRLDSAEDNHCLERYYEKHGFIAVGKCKDGLYNGILRQKELAR